MCCTVRCPANPVDQPVGTGFSYVENRAYASDLPQVGREFVFFLKEFVKAFPEYARQQHSAPGPGGAVDVYIAGESYAGQYIPYITHALLETHDRMPVHLAGIAIGNGYMDPKSQAGSEVDLLLENRVWEKNGREHKEIMRQVDACNEALKKHAKPRLAYPACDAIMSRVLDISTHNVDGKPYCINSYDVRLVDTSPACGMNWPQELAQVYTYLRQGDVRTALHVDNMHKPEAWVECNSAVGSPIHAHAADSDASVTLLPDILQAGVQVLIFAGDKDVMCNYIGLKRMVDRLEWSGHKGLESAAQDWRINGELVGTWQSDRNLTYVRVNNASHMVGYDAPLQAHDMMLRFMDVDMNLASGTAALNTSTVGLDARILVPDRGKTHVPSHAAPPQAALETPRPSASTPKQQPAPGAKFDLLGNLFVIALIAAAVGACLWVRRRSRARPGQYHAVGQYVLGAENGRGPLRSPPRSPPTERVEMEPFALGDEDEELAK